jgi:hypothetical protein
VAAVRRNHALEHATLHVLAETSPHLRLLGRSDWAGFSLYGSADIQEIAEATLIALQRLRAGERQLAIHERCGTNLAVGVVLAGLASYNALSGKRKSWLRRTVELVVGLGTAAALAQPFGLRLQEHVTTSPDAYNLQVTGVQRREADALVVHRITTQQG